MSRRPFVKYLNKYLIETGTYMGDGIQAGLDAGFPNVISYEIDVDFYANAIKRFKGNSKVKLYHKSSATLADELKDINSPVTFYLDSHFSNGDTGYDTKCFYPLQAELEAIKNHHIKTHTILIDDRRLLKKLDDKPFTTNPDGSIKLHPLSAEVIGFTEEEIVAKLKEINPNYIIGYEDGYVSSDVIVAYIP